ncbi:MAG TPA: hypothetical protein VNT50_01830 [Microbacterium sp.]|uniref:hypothetical protein n=1 Tax=Microbacterium sp. TaxID=51671 RepID=UPI002C42A461|nr:hypothetical protein [Microbacterium sp.]HWI30205.1 hypothetical protein [Microbacterium sp.]
MPFSSGLLRDDGFRSSADGRIAIEARVPWMRSLPWDCVLDITVTLDDEAIPIDALRFTTADGESGSFEELRALDGYWVIGEPLTISWGTVADEPPTDAVVTLAVRILIPYMVLPGGAAARETFTVERRLHRSAAD